MGKKKIIVIDDVDLNRIILREAFKKEYEILEAENGLEGLKKIIENQNTLSAIFLDIIMPEMDGFTVLQELNVRSLIQKIPVFLITTDANDFVVEKAYDYGAVDVIPKPFNIMIIRRRVQNMIEFFEAKRASDDDVANTDLLIAMQRHDIYNLVTNIIGSLCEVAESRSREESEHISHIRTIVSLMCEELMKSHHEFGLTDEICTLIGQASALHDIGKIFVSDAILKKPAIAGKLTAEEMEIIRAAPSAGVKFISSIQGIPEPFFTFAKEIVRNHMERWDGKGYPEGLKENQIPLSAQLVSIAEAYDVLVSKRVYKNAYKHAEAVRMINEGECGAFNPIILQCFNEIENEISANLC